MLSAGPPGGSSSTRASSRERVVALVRLVDCVRGVYGRADAMLACRPGEVDRMDLAWRKRVDRRDLRRRAVDHELQIDVVGGYEPRVVDVDRVRLCACDGAGLCAH